MSTQKMIDRQKRSVLFFLSRFPTGAAWFQVMGGYSDYGRQVRNAAIEELVREKKIQRVGYILKIVSL